MEVLQPRFDAGKYVLAARQAVPDWDGRQALTIFEQMLQAANNRIDGVIAANDTLTNAVISPLKARRLALIPMSGLDATMQASSGSDRVRSS
jgi:D-xylose transport system substrate-binding protein